MISVVRLSHNLINSNKYMLTKNNIWLHPSYNPNQFNVNYLYKVEDCPLMLTTINIHDKIYVSSLVHEDAVRRINHSFITKPLFASVSHLRTVFDGEVVMTSNDDELLDEVVKTTNFNWKYVSYTLAHESATEYNKTYQYMYPEKPSTLSTFRNIRSNDTVNIYI